MKAKSIRQSITISGITLHRGEFATLKLQPIDIGSGIIFYKSGVKIALNYKNVVDTTMATTIGLNGVVIHTIEHLMSAVYSLGITDLLIELDSSEPPILDGSSLEFFKIIQNNGIIEHNINRKIIKIKKEIIIKDDSRFVSISPNNINSGFFIDSTISFSNKAIGIQSFNLEVTPENYLREIAPARTFGFLSEFENLKNRGLALGANYENVIVIGDDKILNTELRFENEFVRHKILDVIGDLSILGYKIDGNYKSFASSHTLNYALIKSILSNPKNYEIEN